MADINLGSNEEPDILENVTGTCADCKRLTCTLCLPCKTDVCQNCFHKALIADNEDYRRFIELRKPNKPLIGERRFVSSYVATHSQPGDEKRINQQARTAWCDLSVTEKLNYFKEDRVNKELYERKLIEYQRQFEAFRSKSFLCPWCCEDHTRSKYWMKCDAQNAPQRIAKDGTKTATQADMALRDETDIETDLVTRLRNKGYQSESIQKDSNVNMSSNDVAPGTASTSTSTRKRTFRFGRKQTATPPNKTVRNNSSQQTSSDVKPDGSQYVSPSERTLTTDAFATRIDEVRTIDHTTSDSSHLGGSNVNYFGLKELDGLEFSDDDEEDTLEDIKKAKAEVMNKFHTSSSKFAKVNKNKADTFVMGSSDDNIDTDRQSRTKLATSIPKLSGHTISAPSTVGDFNPSRTEENKCTDDGSEWENRGSYMDETDLKLAKILSKSCDKKKSSFFADALSEHYQRNLDELPNLTDETTPKRSVSRNNRRSRLKKRKGDFVTDVGNEMTPICMDSKDNTRTSAKNETFKECTGILSLSPESQYVTEVATKCSPPKIKDANLDFKMEVGKHLTKQDEVETILKGNSLHDSSQKTTVKGRNDQKESSDIKDHTRTGLKNKQLTQSLSDDTANSDDITSSRLQPKLTGVCKDPRSYFKDTLSYFKKKQNRKQFNEPEKDVNTCTEVGSSELEEKLELSFRDVSPKRKISGRSPNKIWRKSPRKAARKRKSPEVCAMTPTSSSSDEQFGSKLAKLDKIPIETSTRNLRKRKSPVRSNVAKESGTTSSSTDVSKCTSLKSADQEIVVGKKHTNEKESEETTIGSVEKPSNSPPIENTSEQAAAKEHRSPSRRKSSKKSGEKQRIKEDIISNGTDAVCVAITSVVNSCNGKLNSMDESVTEDDLKKCTSDTVDHTFGTSDTEIYSGESDGEHVSEHNDEELKTQAEYDDKPQCKELAAKINLKPNDHIEDSESQHGFKDKTNHVETLKMPVEESDKEALGQTKPTCSINIKIEPIDICDTPGTCEIHAGLKLKLFCETPGCKKLTCSECYVDKHWNHKVVPLEQRYEIVKTEINEHVKELESLKQRLTAHLCDTTMFKDNVKTTMDSFEQQLTKRTKDLSNIYSKEFLQKKIGLAAKQYIPRIKKRKNSFTKSIDKIGRLQDRLNITFRELERLKSTENAIEGLQSYSGINSTLADLRKEIESLPQTTDTSEEIWYQYGYGMVLRDCFNASCQQIKMGYVEYLQPMSNDRLDKSTKYHPRLPDARYVFKSGLKELPISKEALIQFVFDEEDRQAKHDTEKASAATGSAAVAAEKGEERSAV